MDKVLETFKDKTKMAIITFLLFIIGIFIGYFVFKVNPERVIMNLDKLLGNLIEIGEAMNNKSKLHITGLIFQNNIKALLVIIFGGIALGLIPVFSIFFNGFVIGIVMAFSLYQGKSITFFLAGLIPHGILELPAVIMAGAFGLKTGIDIIFPGSKSRKELLQVNLKNSLLSLGVFVPILFLAAAIEATITPYVMKLFI
ncbi:MAG TPA: stage II sporulation protein M [Thermoanaerobacterales bacterium]|nr:stage II sporulation protein M [Thermoanaerobacterales bacterium]